jgi:hypothetical protein
MFTLILRYDNRCPLKLTRFRGHLTVCNTEVFNKTIDRECYRATCKPDIQCRVQTRGDRADTALSYRGRESVTRRACATNIGAGLPWERARKLEGGADAAPAHSSGETLEEENTHLRRDNAILRKECEFTKKTLVFFARKSR